jgi:hypothetical protein
MSWLAYLGPIGEVIKWGSGELSKWSERRDTLKTVTLEAKVASIKAQAEIAAYKAKADLEWDLKWADGASSSWKDEFMLVLWAIPMIGLFIPGIRPFIMEGFEYLKGFHQDAPEWYMAGWAIIFAATFGFKQAASLMLPGKVAKLAGALGSIPDDVPYDIAKAAQGKISKAIQEGKGGLY